MFVSVKLFNFASTSSCDKSHEHIIYRFTNWLNMMLGNHERFEIQQKHLSN